MIYPRVIPRGIPQKKDSKKGKVRLLSLRTSRLNDAWKGRRKVRQKKKYSTREESGRSDNKKHKKYSYAAGGEKKKEGLPPAKSDIAKTQARDKKQKSRRTKAIQAGEKKQFGAERKIEKKIRPQKQKAKK